MRTNSRTILALLLVAAIGLAAGCARRITGKVDVPYGDPMDVQVQSGAQEYKGIVPAFVLDGKSPYFKDLHATFTVTDVINTRIVWADTTALVSLAGQSSQTHLSVILYLCQPLSQKADKYSDGSVAYGGTAYPDIVKGHTYTISGILQPHWDNIPLIYVPTAYDFRKPVGNESFFYGPSDQFKQDPSSMAAEQVVREFFTYWDKKNIPEMEKRMTPNRYGASWTDKLGFVKLISITELKPDETGAKAFMVSFGIKYEKGGGAGIDHEINTWNFLLKRDSDSSPWLIYDYGGGGTY
jgi:hypothetical protein